jgi:hypothetical protein
LAREESNEIKAQAYEVARQMEEEANQYVHEVLGRLEENLLEALKVVHRSKEKYRTDGEEDGPVEKNDD